MFPFLEVAGLGAQIFGAISQQSEAHHRFRLMRQAAKRLQLAQDRDFNTAQQGLRGAQSAWENDPGRAEVRRLWEQKLANPDVVNPAELSLMKNQGYDSAARDSGASVSRIREQAQRIGLGNSRAGLGLEAGTRAQAFSRNASISNDLDLAASKANTASRDSTRMGYGNYLSGENDVRSGYATALANLLGSRSYGDSALLAQMG